MVQFLSIIFFLISSIFVWVFQKLPFFFVSPVLYFSARVARETQRTENMRLRISSLCLGDVFSNDSVSFTCVIVKINVVKLSIYSLQFPFSVVFKYSDFTHHS